MINETITIDETTVGQSFLVSYNYGKDLLEERAAVVILNQFNCPELVTADPYDTNRIISLVTRRINSGTETPVVDISKFYQKGTKGYEAGKIALDSLVTV